MNTKSDTSAVATKVISDTREEEILSLYRFLHTKVLTCLMECDIKPLFCDTFAKCGAKDYKALHQQSRALINAKVTATWKIYISAIKEKIQGVIDDHMVVAREDKEEWDNLSDRAKARNPWSNVIKIPVSDLMPCFPEGKNLAQVVADLDKLCSTRSKVSKGSDDLFYLSLPFIEAEVVETPTAEVVETPTVEAAA